MDSQLLKPRQASLLLILVAVVVSLAFAQSPSLKLNLPGPVTRLPAPGGSSILYDIPYQSGVNEEAQLWIENTRTHRRQMLLGIPNSVSAAWNADGSAFYIADHANRLAGVYDTMSLRRVDLVAGILASDSGARSFAKGHAYFDVDGWQGRSQLVIHFYGHTDAPPPIRCFDFRYRVTRGGSVTKLSERVFPLNDRCG